nr:hypothetical protein [Tanacetum cinerariifolium]
VDGKKVVSSEASIMRDLQFGDEGGVDCLPNKVIFEQLALMGMVKHLDSGNKFLMCPRFIQVFLDKQVDGMSKHNVIYVIPSHTKKIFSNMIRVGKDFYRRETPLFPTMMVQPQEEIGEGTKVPTDPQHTPTIIQPATYQPQRKQRPRKSKRHDTELPQTSVPTEFVIDEAVNKEMSDNLVRATTTASSLEAKHDSGNIAKTQTKATSNEPSSQETSLEDELKRTKTTQQTKIDGLERKVKKLENKQRSITHKLKRLYKVSLTSRVISSSDDEALDKEDTSKERRVDKIDVDEDIALVSTHDDVIVQDKGIEDVVEEEVVKVVTTAKMLIDTIVDAAQVTTAITDILVSAAETIVTTAPTITAKSTKTNVQDKGKGKAKLIEEPEMQKKRKHQVRADEELDVKLQAKTDEEDRLAREKSQQVKEPRALKNKSFAEIQELFDKAMKRINTFVDFRTELVEESTKKDKTETTQESSSKRERDELEEERSKKHKWRMIKSLKSLRNVWKSFQIMEMM